MTKPTAQNAIRVLRRLEQAHGPESVAYFVLPNVVLALSGARATCDGVFWSTDKSLLAAWQRDIKASLPLLKDEVQGVSAAVELQDAQGREGNVTYDLVLRDGLAFVLEQTSLLPGIGVAAFAQCKTFTDFVQIIMDKLHVSEQLRGFSNESLNHIAYGLLLGYPDAAMLGAVTFWQQDDPFAEPLMDADIRGAAYYVGPQPVYHYPRSLVTNKAIREHESLWSGILKDFYTSGFHKALAAEPDFQSKMKKLGSLR